MLEIAHPTPLRDRHIAVGASLIDFAGWEMPVRYEGILAEHRTVRERAGLFDLSHMGELYVEGAEAGQALSAALISDPASIAVGRAQYSMICAADGGVIDDLIVYRLERQRFLVVANASNVAPVRAALRDRIASFDAALFDRTEETALIAVQGPCSADIVGPLVNVDLARLRYYSIANARIAGVDVLVARTGYTGEDGFEVFVPAARAGDIWDALTAAGSPFGLVPVGLGARDTLRLEAGMPLYGNELDRTTTPFEAGLGRVVHFDKPGDFVGSEALREASLREAARVLVGLVVIGRGIARHGHRVLSEGMAVGLVTSGTHSPTLGRPIAMAYVPPRMAEVGRTLQIEIRGQAVPAEVVRLPFYKRIT